jgi:hypothetical protein
VTGTMQVPSINHSWGTKRRAHPLFPTRVSIR